MRIKLIPSYPKILVWYMSPEEYIWDWVKKIVILSLVKESVVVPG